MAMKIVIVGAGYVGLVTGACLAQAGNCVTCIDSNPEKIATLRQGLIPIYEPGLEDLILKNQLDGRLRFSTSLAEAALGAEVFFIAVGTPSCSDGSADLSYVLDVANEIGDQISQYCVIVDKSTVPVGTSDRVHEIIRDKLSARDVDVPFAVVSNPEFLKEGSAIDDFVRPDRIVIGTSDEHARQIMRALYAPFDCDGTRIIMMGPRDAEMTKYAANAMLATKISFINDVANLCEHMGVDVENVRIGIGSDTRIGPSFIYPGCGYGGSCFPKDVRAMIRMADEYSLEPRVLRAVEKTNVLQKRRLFQKITKRFGTNLTGHNFGVWGLAFKPDTDDMRESSSVGLLHDLIDAGARVRAYDPVAIENAKLHLPKKLTSSNALEFVDQQYEALQNADAMALVTAWGLFINPDFQFMRAVMKRPIIFDGRNIYEPALMREWGFEYRGIGR